MTSYNESTSGLEFLTKGACMPTSQRLARHSDLPSLWPVFLAGQAEQPVRVLLIDDDVHMRRLIAQELLADLRIDLRGQGCSVKEGRELISQSEFEVMLLDLNLGDGMGFELIEYMKAAHPGAQGIVISTREDAQHALHAFGLGATGYLVKSSWLGAFAQAVLQVANGGACITPDLARRLLSNAAPALDKGAAMGLDKTKEMLCGSEKEVLKLLAAGHISREIGKRLDMSERTVNMDIKNICRKLNARTRAHAVSLATRLKLF